MNLTDKETRVAEIYKRTRSYAETARELGISRQGVSWIVLNLRVKGVELPRPKRGEIKAKQKHE